VKLRLKAAHRKKALSMKGGGCGPGFGGGADVRLMSNKAADEPRSCIARHDYGSFELDREAESAAGLPPIDFAYDKTLLAGGAVEIVNNWPHFAAAEIEVYQL
jgi:hypothetical protein